MISAFLLIGLVFSFVYSVQSQTSGGRMLIGGSSSSSLTASAVCPPTGGVCNGTLTTLIGIRMPFAATLDKLYGFQGNAPSSGDSCAFTVRTSAGCTAAYSSTALSCTITGNGSLKTCQNTSASVAVAAGDCVQVQFTEIGRCSGFANWGFEAY